MDGSAYGVLKDTKLNKPLLSFASDMNVPYHSNIIYEINKDKTYLVKIKNSTHQNFTDINTFAIGQENNPLEEIKNYNKVIFKSK